MFKSKNTILIVYPTGGSGTFLEWAIRYLIGDEKIFTEPIWPKIMNWNTWDGVYQGNPIDFPKNFYPLNESISIESYLQSDIIYTVARCGIKQLHAQEFVDKYSKYTKKIIVLTNAGSELSCIYNHIRRSPDFGKNILDKFYENVAQTDAVWEVREKISFNLNNYIQSIKELYSVNSGNFINVSIKNLLTDPEKTVRELCLYLDLLPYFQHSNNFHEKVSIWQQNQIFRYKDELCQKIINSITADILLDWSQYKLSIIDEAFIQSQLRDLHNIELKCYNLNVFPKTSTELRNLIV